ncbi:hypothetical protein P4S72_29435 [Vibrio sp. PP-XX7]
MRNMSPNHQSLPDSRLKHFPISFFAIVMGLSGLSIAYKSMNYPTISIVIRKFCFSCDTDYFWILLCQNIALSPSQ